MLDNVRPIALLSVYQIVVYVTVQGERHCPGTASLSRDSDTVLACRSVTKDNLNLKNSSPLNRVTLCSCNTIGYLATYDEAADGVLETPGLECIKHAVYVLSNP